MRPPSVNHQRGHCDERESAVDAFPSLAGAHPRRQLVTTEGPAGEVGRDVRDPDHSQHRHQPLQPLLQQAVERHPSGRQQRQRQNHRRAAPDREAAALGAPNGGTQAAPQRAGGQRRRRIDAVRCPHIKRRGADQKRPIDGGHARGNDQAAARKPHPFVHGRGHQQREQSEQRRAAPRRRGPDQGEQRDGRDQTRAQHVEALMVGTASIQRGRIGVRDGRTTRTRSPAGRRRSQATARR